jgi:hypothetical protein
MEAKENKYKKQEPFSPENTPTPPQVMDPSKAPKNQKKKELPKNKKGSGQQHKGTQDQKS